VLVNGSAVQTYADVTVRALNGKAVATSRVQFTPHSQQQVNIRKLLDSSGASGITAGSITVMQKRFVEWHGHRSRIVDDANVLLTELHR
jgi:hypothetical protein